MKSLYKKRFILFLLIFILITLSFLFPSIAEEKIKTKNEGHLLKIPHWLNLYADIGYINGDNYNFRTEHLEVKGNNLFDFSLGSSIFTDIKNLPLFFDINFSNIFEGSKEKYNGRSSTILFFENVNSHPFFSFTFGSGKIFSNYISNYAFSYSQNIRGEKNVKNYAIWCSLSRFYNNFLISAGGGFLRKNAHYIQYKINENTINLEFTLSYPHSNFIPYISFYNEIYTKPSIKYTQEKNDFLFKTGIGISSSKLKSGLKNFGAINNKFLKNDKLLKYTTRLVNVRKPNIYLYPEKDQKVKVELNSKNNSKIIESIPEYNNGWEVYVSKNGKINENYDYLFYEGSIHIANNLEKGWCLEKKDIMLFFEEKLYEYGFVKKERDDFIEYWSEHLPKSNYYEVYPLVDEQIDDYFSLEITPKLDSIKRLWFYVSPVNKIRSLEQPEIKKFSRKGFVVVEWGVMLK